MTKQNQIKKSSDTSENFNSNVNGTPFVEVNYELYEPRNYGIEYKDVNGEASECESMIKAGFHFILEGDKGLGKTLLINDLCTVLKTHMVPYNCSSSTSDSDLLGHTVIRKDGTFAFQLGILPIGIMCANKFGNAVIYLDEINALPTDTQKLINSVTDDRRMCLANSHIFRVNRGCTLTVIGTMNPLSYSGVNSLIEDLADRIMGKIINLPPDNIIKAIVDWKTMRADDIDRILLLANDIRNLRKNGSLDYSLSTRSLQQFANIYALRNPNPIVDTTNGAHDMAIRMALEMAVVFKMPTEEQRTIVKDKIGDVFGVEL